MDRQYDQTSGTKTKTATDTDELPMHHSYSNSVDATYSPPNAAIDLLNLGSQFDWYKCVTRIYSLFSIGF